MDNITKSIIVRYGELFLKGKNKSYFERVLINNIKNSLKDYDYNLYKISGRIIINKYDEMIEELLLDKLSKVFGIYSISPAVSFETNIDNIEAYAKSIDITTSTFKVLVNRADKKFAMTSVELAKHLGGIILKQHKDLKVSMREPQTKVNFDLRENKETFVFYRIIKGSGGMPVSTSGKALLLLSGGIDSPVAGYVMAKRGLTINAIHFHSFPYTSEQAKQKVITLANILSEYTSKIKLHIVPFTKIQEEIHKKCKSEYMITLMRRYMMRIAQRVSHLCDYGAIITGESLAQVASQTLESITSTNAVVDMPVFRPLIARDKEEIIDIAKKINTFETSILPYEDCCTVFLPENPLIKPKLHKVEYEESLMDIDSLIQDAIDNIEVIDIES